MQPLQVQQPMPAGEREVRAELDRIVSSPEFRNAERLTRLLRHVVERTLEGSVDRLKELLLGIEVFDRTGFDPRIDPIVRVEASRLRKRLDDFYRRSGCPFGLAIGMPKGTYAASFDRQNYTSAPSKESGSRPRIRLAIVSLAPGAEQAADEFIDEAIRSTHFDVVPWTVSQATEADALELAAKSDLDLLVCVTVRGVAETTRVCVRVVDVRRRLYICSESAAAPFGQLASRLIHHLRAGASGPDAQTARKAASPAAYNWYLKGRYYWNLRSETDLWKAVDYFLQAIREDPNCALACAGLADTYSLLANYGAVAPDEVRPKAKEYALRGMGIDGTLAEAHTSLAHVHATYEWDWQTSEFEYLTAIRLNPSYATAHHWYGITLLAPLNRLDEALEELCRARECDAISLSIRRDEGLVRLYRGDTEAALETATHLLALDTRFTGAWWLMGSIAEVQGRFDAALDAFQRSVTLSGRHPRMLGALGHAYGLSGASAEAEAVLTEFERISAERYVSPFDVALVHVGLGRLETAFSYLAQALSLRSYELVTLQVDPRYAPLRSLAAYDQLLSPLGFWRAGQRN